jgi:hypothetical protein
MNNYYKYLLSIAITISFLSCNSNNLTSSTKKKKVHSLINKNINVINKGSLNPKKAIVLEKRKRLGPYSLGPDGSCGYPYIRFSHKDGTIKTALPPYELKETIDATPNGYGGPGYPIAHLTVFLDFKKLGTGVNTFNLDKQLSTGSHSILVEVRTTCNAEYGYPTNENKAQHFNIKLGPPTNSPNLTNPINNSLVCVDYEGEPNTRPIMVTFKFKSDDVHGSTKLHYIIQVANNPDFNNPYLNKRDSSVLGLPYFLHFTFTGNPTEYWRMREVNKLGKGPWSEVAHFRLSHLNPTIDNIPPCAYY